ncbi:hypothetical protein [Oceanobacillus kimchii]|uniref:hypothetical protein n=1 Tax=Oceanobacillus kimchii TaxID=746691 RepID=UPI003B020948
MADRLKPSKWKVRNVNHHYSKEFKFDDYIDKQIKMLAEKMKRSEVTLGKGEKEKSNE